MKFVVQFGDVIFGQTRRRRDIVKLKAKELELENSFAFFSNHVYQL